MCLYIDFLSKFTSPKFMIVCDYLKDVELRDSNQRRKESRSKEKKGTIKILSKITTSFFFIKNYYF